MTPTSLHDRIVAADPAADVPGPGPEERRRRVDAILAEPPPPAPARARRRVARAAIAVSAALATASAATLALAPRDGDPAVPGAIRAFAAEVAGGQGILHVVSEQREYVDGEQRGPTLTQELWFALDGGGWRHLSTGGDWIGLETSDGPGGIKSYNPRENTVWHDSPRSDEARAKDFIAKSWSRVGNLQESLRDGTAQLSGETMIDGREAYVVTMPDSPTPTRFYVARDDSALLRSEVDQTEAGLRILGGETGFLRQDMREFTVLADTPENRRLIEMPEHPGAKVLRAGMDR